MKIAYWILALGLAGLAPAVLASEEDGDDEPGVVEQEAEEFTRERTDTATGTAEDEVESRRREAEEELDDSIEDAVRGFFD